MTDKLICTCIGLVNDILNSVTGLNQVIPEPFGNLTRGINDNSAKIFVIEQISVLTFLFMGNARCRAVVIDRPINVIRKRADFVFERKGSCRITFNQPCLLFVFTLA